MEKESEPSEQDTNYTEKTVWMRLKALLGLKGSFTSAEDLEQEIQELLDEGEEQGIITSHEERLFSSIFDFRETVASEVMTPLAEIVAAEENSTVADLIRLVTEEGYTRIPIYRNNLDNILGILHAKDLLRICTLEPDAPFKLDAFLMQPSFIPEDKPITDLLREFQTKKNHIAFVTDEFGGVRGLVTLEDIIEEIVGEIDDEHDQEEKALQIIDENTIIVNAKIDIENVAAHFQINIEDGPFESVGGLMLNHLGFLPESGATVAVDGLRFRVISADRRRIRTVQVKRIG